MAFLGPLKGVGLLGEGGEGSGYVCIVRNERSLVAQNSKYASDFFDSLKFLWPIVESVHLLWVNGQLFTIHNQSEVLNMGFLEFALGWSEEI